MSAVENKAAPAGAIAAAGTDFKTGYALFVSTVSASTLIDKNTDRVKALLAAQKVSYNTFDIAANSAAKTFMQTNSGNANKNTIPQVFKDGVYIGGKDELDEANEDGVLKDLLKK